MFSQRFISLYINYTKDANYDYRDSIILSEITIFRFELIKGKCNLITPRLARAFITVRHHFSGLEPFSIQFSSDSVNPGNFYSVWLFSFVFYLFI